MKFVVISDRLQKRQRKAHPLILNKTKQKNSSQRKLCWTLSAKRCHSQSHDDEFIVHKEMSGL